MEDFKALVLGVLSQAFWFAPAGISRFWTQGFARLGLEDLARRKD